MPVLPAEMMNAAAQVISDGVRSESSRRAQEGGPVQSSPTVPASHKSHLPAHKRQIPAWVLPRHPRPRFLHKLFWVQWHPEGNAGQREDPPRDPHIAENSHKTNIRTACKCPGWSPPSLPRETAAPQQPDSLANTWVKRWSAAPASRAVFPSREWPATPARAKSRTSRLLA